jgi:hypothetical protein
MTRNIIIIPPQSPSIPAAIPPSLRGAFDQRLTDVGWDAVAGAGRWRYDARFRIGGPSRVVPAHQPCVAGPRDGGAGNRSKVRLPRLGPQRWIGVLEQEGA